VVAHAGVNNAPCHYDSVLTGIYCSRQDCKRWICAKHTQLEVAWVEKSKKCSWKDSCCWCKKAVDLEQVRGQPICSHVDQGTGSRVHEVCLDKPEGGYPKTVYNWPIIVLTAVGILVCFIPALKSMF